MKKMIRFKRSFITSLMCIILSFVTYGQEEVTQFRFEKIPSEVGFLNSGVNDIKEDHLGFLWVATWAGLAKYDGYSVQFYRQEPENLNGLKSNKVTTIFEDSKNQLWVGTSYSGFYRYNRQLDVFEQFCKKPKDMNSLSDNNVSSIIEDFEGGYWIGTERGLNRFDASANNYIHYENDVADARSLSHNFVYSLAQMPDSSLWVGTEEGLNRLIRKGKEEYFIRYDLAPEGTVKEAYLSHNFIFKIIPSKFYPNTFWVCTSVGLKKVTYFPDSPTEIEYVYYHHDPNDPNSLSHPFVSDVLEEDEDRIWISTYNGVNLLNTKTRKNRYFVSVMNDPYSLGNNVTMALEKDRTNNLWVGLDKGINKLNLNAKAFSIVHPDAKESTAVNINCLAPAKSQRGVWAGSRGGGLNFLALTPNDNLTSETKNYIFYSKNLQGISGFITDLVIDQSGWLWLATDGAGVLRIKEEELLRQQGYVTNAQQFTKSDELSDDYVMAAMESFTGDIWFGYWDKGLDRYDQATGTFHHYLLTHDLGVNFQLFPIVHLIETVEENQAYLWLGTRGGGVYKLKFNEEINGLALVTKYSLENSGKNILSNDFINSFFIDSQNRLWIGTDNGLNLLTPGKDEIQVFYGKDGLANATVQSILESEDGNIWLSSQQGISCLMLAKDSFLIKNYDTFNGLQDNFFHDEAAFRTSSGQLLFGGVNGVSCFNPRDLFLDTIPPKIVITDFKLFNRSVEIGERFNGKEILNNSISATSKLSLSHRENVVSFEFTGLHFGEPKKINYAYQLVGFDQGWVYTDAGNRLAHYTNLPYDEFIFKVKAANGDGTWSEPVELLLNIRPPFWLTGWAYSFYALLVIAIVYFGIRITRMRAEFKHNLELERLDREKLEEVNWLKLQFFTNLSHEFRTPLTLIISPLEQLLQQRGDRKMHKVLSRMYFNANKLLTLINQFLDIRKNEAGLLNLHVVETELVELSKEISLSFRYLALQKKIDLSFSSSPEKIFAWVDHEQLEKVIFNLLSNAIKFTKDEGRVDVHIEEKDKFIEITVSDTGIGIPKSELNNIFERFYQVESHQDRSRRGGTGIGLSLVKMIVEKHHGTIRVDSTEGRGTNFTIQLLKGKSHFDEDELYPDEITEQDSNGFVLPKQILESNEFNDLSAALTPVEENGGSKPKILVVEDNPDVRDYLRENLEYNYKIIEATDGQEGLEKALHDPPDLVLADIAMPRMDGIEMCSKIKSHIETCHVPVILLTARTSLVFKVDGLETGADDYITKPFHMRLLEARIKNLIDNRSILKQHFAKNFDLSPSGVVLNSMDEQLLSQIKVIVERHIDDSNFSVDQLASSLAMSRIQLYRKLKSLTGKSPNKIIRNFRLKRAAELLKSGQYNVSDVTYLVGYNDLKSFRDQFKKEFGTSPSKYNK